MSVGEHPRETHYQFGPFRVDPEKELIFRDGEPIPLTPKAFQILLVLLRHAPKTVTKDDLMKAVWPDSFVEEANLSRNIFLLRKAVGEGPQDHRFILTVPGRGYRLAERVQLVPATPAEHENVAEATSELNIVAASQSQIRLRVSDKLRPVWVAGGVFAVLVAVASAAWLLWPRTPKLTEKDAVVLTDFTNTTGDPVFDETLRQGMAVQLEQSPYLSLISEDQIRRTLQLMGRPADARLTADLAREICERNGAAAVLVGSIHSLGSAYVLGLSAKNCSSGKVVDEEQIQAAKKEEVLSALSQIVARFRKRTGESLVSVEKYSLPLEEATTTSLEALQFYSRSVKVAFTSGFASAVPLMQKAIEIDPKFALAHSHLGLFYSAIGESELAIESDRKAYELRDRVSEREKFFISALYHRNVTGDLQKGLQTLQLWTQAYPRDILAHSLLSGFTSQGLSKYQLSLDEARLSLTFDAEFTPAYVNQAFSELYLDRPQDAENTVQQALAHKLQIPELLLLQYLFDTQKGDVAAMEQNMVAAQGKPGAEDWLLHAHSLALARSGRLTAAREASERAVQSAETAGERGRAGTYKAAAALWEALYGNSSVARTKALAAVQLSGGRDTEYAAALALAVGGDTSRAHELANDLQKRFPEDTSVVFNYLPALRGMLALQRGVPIDAIDSLRVATANELGVSAEAFNYFFGTLDPVYIRGQALLGAGQPTEAAAELNKIVAHRGLLMADPLEAIARLQLARAYTKMGDAAKAKAAYADLLSIWRDADRDLPLAAQARAEFAKLR
jgi:eukaryotic-like serine/threonine-protein kinase